MTRKTGKTIRCGALVLGMALLGAATARAGVDGREANQRDRIAAGVQDGSLTQPETNRLLRQQTHIERMEYRMRNDDGHLGPHERLRLDRALDRSSAHIAHARHDAQTR
jgi:hypothetical protein